MCMCDLALMEQRMHVMTVQGRAKSHSQGEQRDRQGVKKGLTLQLRAGVVSC